MADINGHKPNVGIGDIADSYLLCRSRIMGGHDWRSFDVAVTRYEYRVETECSQCGTHRVQIFDKQGYIKPDRSFYRYPEQMDTEAQPYLMKGLGRLNTDDRARLRVLSIKQITKRGKQT